MSINTVTISGNLGRDPELRVGKGGTSILNLSVAVNSRRKNDQGEWDNYTNWVDVVMFGNYAEKIASQLCKGMPVCVSGELSYNSWEKDGQKRSKLEVRGNEIVIMRGETQSAQQSVQQPVQANPQPELYTEDIPF